MKLLIYAEFNSSRLQFVCQQIFVDWYGWEYTITNHIDVFKQYEGACLNYSKSKIRNKEVFIPCTHLLKSRTIQPLEFSNFQYIKIPAFFKKEQASTIITGDLLSIIFIHLSRYEEYLPYAPDQHGRFTDKESWAAQFNYLTIPIIDKWMNQLFGVFLSLFPHIPPLHRSFNKLITYDIDMAWAYLHKGFFRSMGGIVKTIWEKNYPALSQRLAVIRRQVPDPYQTFSLIENWNKQYAYPTIFFFLLGKHGQYDKNIVPSNPHFQQLIRRIAAYAPIGIHPSYGSNTQPPQLALEIKTLAHITQQPIVHSRQHFLKLHLPYTYQQLLKLGIQHDYSMGYADAIGFRAGTSLPFYWYDLEQERRTDLIIHPFQVMDVTLKEYLLLSPIEAKQQIQELIEATKAENGTFCSLWHNSSFSYLEGWEEWRGVYEFLLKY